MLGQSETAADHRLSNYSRLGEELVHNPGYYNQDLFRAAGLPDPYELNRQGKWDWPAFVHAAETLTRRDAADRPQQFGTTSATFPLFSSVIWNHGGVSWKARN
ncbi:MAG: extracellular solute-binding protein [Armatimonadetes bacterium]|nr:extracellular solute-binding protein [Armatimonadota bacterium]